MDCVVYLVTYEGQTESPYTWSARTEATAEHIMESLAQEYPDRKWQIMEKDVS